jgi:hypothetical protein
MLIQCPNCGRPGRVPDDAVAIPHRARCPQCHHQFELGTIPAPVPPRYSPASGIEVGPDRRDDGDVLGPGSSSYEHAAITEDFGPAWDRGEAAGLWNDGEDDPPRTGPPARDEHPGKSRRADAAPRSVPPAPAQPRPGVARPGQGPWYGRLLDGWAILLLIWALLIVARALLILQVPGAGPPDAVEAIPSVVAALRLVGGAAGLFLLADLGRNMRHRCLGFESLTRYLRQVSSEPTNCS